MPRKSIAPHALAIPPGLFRRRLLTWYERAGRDLPWRRTRDPYEVLVSEVMLQQTQVTRVREYYPRFLDRFPDVASLASAPAHAVREAWDGLGYYARARNLHALARVVTGYSVAGKGVAENSVAKLPDDPEELIKLPGVGRYTAGAIASFAYEKSVPAVDTNVARVIRRVFFGERLISQRLIRQRSTRQRPTPQRSIPLPLIWSTAAALVPKDGKRAWKFNQAIMELGALVCTARRPKCGECPVRSGCKTGRPFKRKAVSSPKGASEQSDES
jgi:A/G-specific adenine glycosylase